MRDTRVKFFATDPLTISTATTTNGNTIDLLEGIEAGSYFEGVARGRFYGLNLEIIITSITGSQCDAEIHWEVSDDGNTWETDVQVYEGAIDEDDNGGTKLVIPTSLVTKRRYAKLVIVTSNMAGSSFVVRAWLSDGVVGYGFGENSLRR